MDFHNELDLTTEMRNRLLNVSDAKVTEEVRKLIDEFGGHVCCLACCMKVRRFSNALVDFLLRERISVKTLWEGDRRTLDFCSQFSREQNRLGFICVLAVLETNPPDEALVVHQRYYQKDHLVIKYVMPTFSVQVGMVQRGQIVEIFHQPNMLSICDAITKQLVKDFWMINPSPQTYPNLPNVENDCFESFNSNNGLMSVGRYVNNSLEFRTKEPLNWNVTNNTEKWIIVSEFFKGFSMLSMVIIWIEDYGVPGMSAVNTWLELFSGIGRGLDDVILVFAVNYQAFQRVNVNTKSGARALFNKSIPTVQKSRFHWMDISKDNISNADVRNHLNLCLMPLLG